MVAWNDLYLRDTLSDTGDIPSPGYPYYSPDLIAQQQQVTDPQSTFSANYNQNISDNIEYGVYNYVYLRTKNLGSGAIAGTIKCYWSKTSLVMWPDQWVNNYLQTAANKAEIPIAAVQPGAIGVTAQPFVWNAPSVDTYGYCMIGQVITPSHPSDIPSGSMSWGTFVSWVRNQPNVCWRNLHIVNSFPDPQYARLMVVANNTANPTPATFRSICTNLPSGTVIHHQCAPLNIEHSQTITTPKQDVYSSGTMPTNFQGSLQVSATLPSGASWTGEILTISYIGVDERFASDEMEVLHQYADSWDAHSVTAEDVGLSGNGRLVQVGNASSLFQP